MARTARPLEEREPWSLADASTVLSTEQKQQVSSVLEEDAQLMSNTGLAELVADEPPDAAAEVIRINTEARHVALQVALLIPILAAGLGVLNAFRMRKLPDPKASSAETLLG